jgi:hypothetical protein
MLISGEALIHSFKLPFSIHGERGGVWKVTVSGPGQLHTEGETQASPYELLDTMLSDGFKKCCQLFPNQAPPPPPLPRPRPALPVPESEPEPAAPKRKTFNRRMAR